MHGKGPWAQFPCLVNLDNYKDVFQLKALCEIGCETSIPLVQIKVKHKAHLLLLSLFLPLFFLFRHLHRICRESKKQVYETVICTHFHSQGISGMIVVLQTERTLAKPSPTN